RDWMLRRPASVVLCKPLYAVSSEYVIIRPIPRVVLRVHVPLDCSCDAALDALAPTELGRPPQQRLGFGVVGPEPLDLTGFGAEALRLALDLDGAAHHLRDDARRVTDAHLEVASDVRDAPYARFCLGQRHEPSHCVRYVGEVPRWLESSQFDALSTR